MIVNAATDTALPDSMSPNPGPDPAQISLPREVFVNVLLLGVILAINFFVRHSLDQSDTRINSFMIAAWKDSLPEIYALPWWRYFLPIESMTGSWCTTSLLLVHWMEQWMPSPASIFYLTNAIMVTTAYVLSFGVFRSRVFSATLSLCFALTTFNHHVYLISGTVMMPLVVSYLLFFLFC